MDGNKDESERCMRLVESLFLQKNFTKALKFAVKADQLYSCTKTKELLAKANLLNSHDQQQQQQKSGDSGKESGYQDSSNDRQSGGGGDNSNGSGSTNSTSNEKNRSVEYIKNCKDYYEILSVPKNATDSDIKKQYRKLALQFHPDKNKTPGASEAFKAIGNAFAVLSDAEKRRRYDQVGPEESGGGGGGMRRRSHRYDYSRGFEEDYNAEEIFNMFFGGGFPSRNVFVYRNGGGAHQRHHHNEQSHGQSSPAFGVLLQILPILLFVVISLLGTLVPDNPYSMTRNTKYPYQRTTLSMKVPYYVKDGFERDYSANFKTIEKHVEETYVSNLQTSCFRERNYKENLRYQARFYRNAELEEKARNFPTPSCARLEELEQSYF